VSGANSILRSEARSDLASIGVSKGIEMALSRIRAIWSGFVGAPGVSTFYADDATVLLPAIGDFFTNISGLLPNDVTVTVDAFGDIIDETTGGLTGSWTASAVGPATGTGGDNYAAPVGMCVDWNTGVVMDLHRLRGRTFVVPCSGAQFDVDGSPLSTAVSGLQSAGDALIAADGNLMVWHRPRAAKAADGSRPAVTARAGGYANVTTAHVPDKAVVLRSRRD